MTPTNLEELKRAAEAATPGEGNRVQGMVRDFGRWAKMDPKAVAAGSEAQVVYALEDAKTDIAALSSRVLSLISELEAERERRRGAEEALTGLMHAAKDAHIEDDLIASIWPDKHERNGQPTVDVVKNARRAMNAGRAHFQSQEASDGE